MSLELVKDTARTPRYAGAMAKPRPKTTDSISTNLKRLMTARKWSQSELARLSGVSQTHIGGILRGESDCTVDMANQLAHPFGTTGWVLIMPNLPDELINSTSVQTLMDFYLGADADGREFLDAAMKMAVGKKKGK